MKFFKVLAFVAIGGLSSCAGSKSAGGSQGLVNEDLIGTWDTEDVAVRLVGKGGGSKDSSFTIVPGNIANGGQVPVTFFNANGSYRDEVRSAEGAVLKSNKGHWHLNADTLYLRMETQGNNETQFGIRKRGKYLELKNIVDWDGDGAKDDWMEVKLKRR